jgi:glucosamine--fructose-6-phosphate aminotransferase (isomerizing)
MLNNHCDQFDLILALTADGSPVSAFIICQLLAYYVAVARDLDPGRPRNLAKSVTVL